MSLNHKTDGIKSNQILPKDFIQFLSKNYKTINDIEKKVEQFQNDPWSNFYKKFGCRNWRNLRLKASKCDSIDSCFSDKDVKKVIKAKLKPKMKRLESNERIEVDESFINESKENDGFDKAPLDFSYLFQNFPMVYFAPDLQSKKKEVESLRPFSLVSLTSSNSSRLNEAIRFKLPHFILKGNKFPLIRRSVAFLNEESSDKKNETEADAQQLQYSNSVASSFDDDLLDLRIFNDSQISGFRKQKHNREVDEQPSRQLLTLTLPPLHQSVLTLLGQKSGVKSSPRGLSTDPESTGANKAKKLRRHGRKKKSKEDGKDSEERDIEKSSTGTETKHREGRGNTEELQETQLSTLENRKHLADDDNEDEEDGSESQSFSYLKQMQSLRDVLDDHLRKEQWNQKEMENLNEEIDRLSEGLKKYQTEFKAKSISIQEDTWLSFPRTCTRNSATFGVPWNSQQLRELRPVDYLRNYVMITEPRLHLYNLVYQRYRMLENPMGKSITVKSLQRSLTEVLGRQFTDEEMAELKNVYLNIDDNQELDSKAFAGVCAFCERIYGKYELEKCKECAICSRTKINDKERCHIKGKSELEEIDLSYLINKIKLGEASFNLEHLIMALTKSSHA